MEKIILTEKTVGNIVGRLKKFMENHVFTSQCIYNIKPTKARRTIQHQKDGLGKSYSRKGYYMNAKVTRHSFSKGDMRSYRNRPTPFVHIHFHSDAGTCFREGDVFYFYGSMILVDVKTDTLLKGQSSIGNKTRMVDKYQLISSPDPELIKKIQSDFQMEEAYAKDYWDGVREEQEKENAETEI